MAFVTFASVMNAWERNKRPLKVSGSKTLKLKGVLNTSSDGRGSRLLSIDNR
jgi:hypothetical protein